MKRNKPNTPAIGNVYVWKYAKDMSHTKLGYVFLLFLTESDILGFGGANGIKVLFDNAVFDLNRTFWVEV